MINPTQSDIGRKVVYQGFGPDAEEGVITSFNDSYVFVQYKAGATSQATCRDDLVWALGTDRDEKNGMGLR